MGSRAAPVDAVSGAPTCPFCDAGVTERVGQWGGQIITAQWRCQDCGSYFEALRDEFAGTGGDDVREERPAWGQRTARNAEHCATTRCTT